MYFYFYNADSDACDRSETLSVKLRQTDFFTINFWNVDKRCSKIMISETKQAKCF